MAIVNVEKIYVNVFRHFQFLDFQNYFKNCFSLWIFFVSTMCLYLLVPNLYLWFIKQNGMYEVSGIFQPAVLAYPQINFALTKN